MLIRVSLDRYLERHNLSAYRLANELKGRVAQGSVYAMTRSKTVKRIDLETLTGILQALERITGEAVTPNDLLEVIQEPESDPMLLEGDASSLGEIDPYDWGNLDPNKIGEPIEASLSEASPSEISHA